MADFAALRTTHETGFAHAERGEVVVQHERVFVFPGHGVDDLGVAPGSQRGRHDRLGFAARKQGGTMCAGQHAALDGNRADRAQVAAVDARVAGKDVFANQGFLQLGEGAGNFILRGRVFVVGIAKRLHRGFLHLGDGVTALHLVGNGVSIRQSVPGS